MQIAAAIADKSAAPFESASELREAHGRLLELLDAKLVHDASAKAEAAALAQLEPDVRQFVERGAATGAYLEEITERTACQTLLDYWTSSLSHAGVRLRSIRLAPFDREQLPDLKDKPCPYVGLEAFREPTFFFGRDADIQGVLAQLRDAPLVVVAGASGSGKSSLIIAGVLPALAAGASGQALSVIPPFVPGNAVLDHLASAVLQSGDNTATEAAALRENPGRLAAMVGGEQARATLITIDQFEEVFTLSDSADREALVNNLARFLEAGRGHRVILTVREEFKDQIAALRPLDPYLKSGWYSMRPMGYDALRAAIEEPAKRQNLQFHSGIVDDLAKKVLGQPAALPLLQFALRSLWDARDRNRITWEVYRKVGDPLNALNTSAERFYGAQSQETRDEVKRILLELVRVDELLEAYRQPVPESRLLEAGRANTHDVLRLLAENEYIRITPGSNGADAVVDVQHESLVRNWPRFVDWIDEKRHQVRQRLALTQAAARWEASGRPVEGLLTGWQLDAAKDLTDLSDVEKAFVQASNEALDRKQRRDKLFYWSLVTAAAAVAAAAIVISVVLWRNNTEIARQAELLRLNAEEIQRKGDENMRLQSEAYETKAEHDAQQWKTRLRVLQAVGRQPLNYSNDQRDLAVLLSVDAIGQAPDQPAVLRSLLSILTSNRELSAIVPGHAGVVRAVRSSPDGKMTASASIDETNQGIIILRHRGGRLLFPPLKGHQGTIYELAFSNDGKTLASVGEDKTVRLWDIETGDIRKTLSLETELFGVAINNTGTLLAAAGKDGVVTLWDLRTDKKTSLLHAAPTPASFGSNAVRKVAFSPDGKLLASAGQDGRIVLWDTRTRKQTGKPLAIGDDPFSLAFSYDGKFIASGSRDGYVDLWNVAKRTGTRLAPHLRGVYGVAFSRDNKYLATVSADRSVHVFDLGRPDAEPKDLKGYAKEFYSVDFAPDGKLVTGTGNGMVVVWDLTAPYAFGARLNSNTEESGGAAFTGDGRTVTWHAGNALYFMPAEKTATAVQKVPSLGQAQITLIVPAPNGKELVTVGADNSIELWDSATRRPIGTIVQPNKNQILAAAYSSDGQTLNILVRNSDSGAGELHSIDMPGGKPERTLTLDPWPSDASMFAFSPRGDLLAVAAGTTISLWRLSPFKQLPDLHEEDVVRLAFAADVISLAFSPDGRFLASGRKDSVISLWNLETNTATALEAHRSPVTSLAFTPDGKRLASGSKDKSLMLWDVSTGQQLTAPITAFNEQVTRLAFSNPDGRWMVSSAGDGSIDFWFLNVPTLLVRACEVVNRNFTDKEWNRFFGGESPRMPCPGAMADEADDLAMEGDHQGAERLFEQAMRIALSADEPEVPNIICWLGALDGYAMMVKPACERAVETMPEATRDLVKDSRGLAKALSGDTDGAIQDFTAAVEYLEKQPDHDGFSEEFLRRRKTWIAALKNGGNPFDDKKLLKALRTEE